MTKYKRSDFRPALDEIMKDMPEERRENIYAGAAEIIKDVRLAELRKAMEVTQVKLAKKSGISQADISRIENRPETVQLRTMERYVRSLGGTFKIVAEFPDGMVAQIPLRAGKPRKIEDSRGKAEARPGQGPRRGVSRNATAPARRPSRDSPSSFRADSWAGTGGRYCGDR